MRHNRGQVLSAEIYLSLIIITMSPTAVLEESRENACQNILPLFLSFFLHIPKSEVLTQITE